MHLKALFRLATNLLRLVQTIAGKVEKFPIICSNLTLCNSHCSRQLLVWTQLKSSLNVVAVGSHQERFCSIGRYLGGSTSKRLYNSRRRRSRRSTCRRWTLRSSKSARTCQASPISTMHQSYGTSRIDTTPSSSTYDSFYYTCNDVRSSKIKSHHPLSIYYANFCYTQNNVRNLKLKVPGREPWCVVKGGDSYMEGCEFESQAPDLGWTFFTLICCKIVMFGWKNWK